MEPEKCNMASIVIPVSLAFNYISSLERKKVEEKHSGIMSTHYA